MSLLSIKPHASHANRLIAGLPYKDQQHFLAGCELIDLVVGDTLYKSSDPVRHVYFPLESYISIVTPVAGHSALEVALVGNEGMQGISVVLGVNISQFNALVQGQGHALRMNAARFRHALNHSPALKRIMNRYIYVLTTQVAQMSVCNRFHMVEARLARWLLMTQDRAHSNNLHITQECLAMMLGVRRVGITKGAGSLQQRKLIHYRRGNITIIDRHGLEVAACECYQADKATYEGIIN
jgi:CRP-like cAMP-binding protein